MRRTGLVLLSMALAGQAHGQAAKAPAPAPTSLTCGNLKGDSSQTSSTWRWTISGPSGKTTETGVLRGSPRFECVDGAILVVETTSTAGYSVFVAYFPDGSDISYGRQQVDRRGNRWILPIQAKVRIAASFRGAFDYHCKLNMPADPIDPATRMDCVK